ncbi:MAG: DUF6476 family protein [Roseinatronobacter sp.]
MALPPDMPPPAPPPPDVRLIKGLVVVLTSVMILGVIVIIGLLVTRLGMAPAPVALPDSITLPSGTTPQAITLARDWVLVLTQDDQVLLFDRGTGALRHQMALPQD